MDSARPLVTIAIVAALTLVAAGCGSKTSSTPSASPAAATTVLDPKTLAGKWEGYARPTSGPAVPIELDVRPDGTYVSRMGATSGTGTFRVMNGTLVTEGHLSGAAFADAGKSTAVVRDRNGRLVLSGNGRNDAGPYSYELTKRQ
jgi:hypothetical protein